MRLVGLALLVAWLVAWSAAPHGEPARSTSIVGAVACAGGDSVAAAWLELRHGEREGVVKVAIIGPDGVMRGEPFQVAAGQNAVAFRLADAGDGSFVFVTEHRTDEERWLEMYRVGVARSRQLPPLAISLESNSWQIAAAGDELIVRQTVEPGDTIRRSRGGMIMQATPTELIGDRTSRHIEGRGWEEWTPGGGRKVLVGAGGGHVIRYELDDGGDRVVAGDHVWEAAVSRPPCRGITTRPTITSVVGLRGGYARLSRKGAIGCVDGIRDGAPFMYENVPLGGIASARLAADPAGHLTVYEEEDAQVTRRRVVLPEDRHLEPHVDSTVHPSLDYGGVRYRIFGGDGVLGTTDVATRVTRDETQVILERHGAGGAQVLAPARRYLPDHRPLLRWLSLLPMTALLLSVAGGLRLRRRLDRLRAVAADGLLAAGRAVIEGTLALDADAPAGGLRVRMGGQLVTLFIEGADVLRASEMRPRSQPRGDAVDVAAGAPVVASGVVDGGVLYRDDTQLRSGPGDLVVVGCTVAEARARATRRVFTSLSLCATAALLIVTLIAR